MENFWKTIWKSVFHPFAAAKTHDLYEKDMERYRTEIKLLEREINELEQISLIANEHGWNGVENSKILSCFIQEALSDRDRLRAELKEIQQENEDLKNINMRLHEKINLLTPEGLRDKELFPTNYRKG